MTRHVNIPIFIPHLGCPNQCVFCNQRHISGVKEFDPSSLVGLIEEALSTVDVECEVEIAFFGGSFTGIDRALMITLLETAYTYIQNGRIASIRCSTRPDYIDAEILGIFKRYGVRTVELGLQSSSDHVLKASKRGHNFEAEAKACRLIVENGFELVGQMMIGLPGSTLDDEIKTADFIIGSGASAARIYPTVVFHDTELANMADMGMYLPLSLKEAVERSSAVFERFIRAGIDVIRIGLCSSENLISDKTYHSGPNHPALGELIVSNYYYNEIERALTIYEGRPSLSFNVYVTKGSLSKAIGHRGCNREKLRINHPNIKLKFCERSDIPKFGVSVEINNGEI